MGQIVIDWTAVGAIATPLVTYLALRAQNKVQHKDTTAKIDDVNVKIADVKAEVVTGNASKMGELAADDETRRVLAKPEDERTATERAHIEQIPPLT